MNKNTDFDFMTYTATGEIPVAYNGEVLARYKDIVRGCVQKGPQEQVFYDPKPTRVKNYDIKGKVLRIIAMMTILTSAGLFSAKIITNVMDKVKLAQEKEIVFEYYDSNYALLADGKRYLEKLEAEKYDGSVYWYDADSFAKSITEHNPNSTNEEIQFQLGLLYKQLKDETNNKEKYPSGTLNSGDKQSLTAEEWINAIFKALKRLNPNFTTSSDYISWLFEIGIFHDGERMYIDEDDGSIRVVELDQASLTQETIKFLYKKIYNDINSQILQTNEAVLSSETGNMGRG